MGEEKPKVAFYWCASCGGCEEAVVDLAEDILQVVEAVDIVFWPVALDFKREDVERIPDGGIAVAFVNGAIRTEEQEEMAHLLRRKAQLLIAFGSCAHLGGIPGLGNLWTRADILERVYKLSPSTVNPQGVTPQGKVSDNGRELTLPPLLESVRTLDQVVEVDYYLPGCPPPPDIIRNALEAILKGELPPKGTVLAPTKTLCDTCPRQKPEEIRISEIRRVHEVAPDPEKCFLEQGIICLGPVTRSGCGERCIKANMPCRGCFGPTDTVADQGVKFVSSLASILDADDPKEAERLIKAIADPIGTFYRFSLPASILRRRQA